MSRLALKIFIVLLLLPLLSGCDRPGQREAEPADGNMEDAAIAVPQTSDGDFGCTAVSEIATAECQALIALYEATNGSAWLDNSGWLETNTPCSWAGVTCVNGRVDMLALYLNNLQGQLPDSLAGLAHLRVLDLHNNALSGEIPAALGQLAHLETLDLSANQISGAIPVALGDLPKLQSLALAYNQLSGPIPTEIGQIATLRNLDLSHNQLSGALPDSLANLVALESLRLSDNQIEGAIPFGLGELAALTEIDLSFNHLTGTAPSALQQVSIHRLWGNQLDGTIMAGDAAQQSVSFLGATFTFDQTLADSVWPELVPALPATPGPGLMWVPPEHIVFTLVRADGPQNHNPLGLHLPAEAQIHVYPTAELNAEVQPVVAALQQLLAQQPDLATYEMVEPEMEATQPGLTMLPPSNARQTLRAQAQYVSFADGLGVRYLTQLSQGPGPVNNQDLFYTFQGLTADGATYVAAYFPVALPELPHSPELSDEEFAAFLQDWPEYLAQTTEMLNGQPAIAFTPELAALDALINSLSASGTTAVPMLDGIWPENGESVDNQPVLQWAAFPGAAQYELVIVDDDAYPPFVSFSQLTTDLVIPVTPALEPGSYSWTVRALDTHDKILAELNRQFLVKAMIEVVGPANFETVAAMPTLTWQAFPGATSYQVVVLDDDAYPPVVVSDQTTADTTFAVTSPLEPGSYSWTVWAKDANDVVLAEAVSQFVVEK